MRCRYLHVWEESRPWGSTFAREEMVECESDDPDAWEDCSEDCPGYEEDGGEWDDPRIP